MEEQWRPIKSFEGRYEISSFGRVKSLAREYVRREKFLTQKTNGVYATVVLSKGITGSSKTKLVHGLVAETFIGPRPEGAHVAHNDGDVTNNHLSNLRYATPKENSFDKRRHGKHREGETHHLNKLTDEQVRLIRNPPSGKTVKMLAAEFGVHAGHAYNIRYGTRKNTYEI